MRTVIRDLTEPRNHATHAWFQGRNQERRDIVTRSDRLEVATFQAGLAIAATLLDTALLTAAFVGLGSGWNSTASITLGGLATLNALIGWRGYRLWLREARRPHPAGAATRTGSLPRTTCRGSA